jgi:hypothetical protein
VEMLIANVSYVYALFMCGVIDLLNAVTIELLYGFLTNLVSLAETRWMAYVYRLVRTFASADSHSACYVPWSTGSGAYKRYGTGGEGYVR